MSYKIIKISNLSIEQSESVKHLCYTYKDGKSCSFGVTDGKAMPLFVVTNKPELIEKLKKDYSEIEFVDKVPDSMGYVFYYDTDIVPDFIHL